MALQDILDAISEEANRRIAEARAAHEQQLRALRDEHDAALTEKKQEIAVQKEEKKKQLRSKSESHAGMVVRNAELKRKQALLDELYQTVTKELCALNDKDLEAFLTACLKGVKRKGVVHPAKNHEKIISKLLADGQTMGDTIEAEGGFVLISDTEEHDRTFSHLVQTMLRPETEVSVAHSLFTS